ncbi:MAG: CehA/McbA family metallohydrolase [Planctomycetes bacterium]|nr:CehA/McbA family metallohydrolase [Planctomycetota bacterium]
MIRIRTFALGPIALLSLLFPTLSIADHPKHDGKMAVFGTLHAHSVLSGDVKDEDGFTPMEAFDYARENGLDFLGISDHHKPTGAPGGSKFHMATTTYKQKLVAVADQVNTAHAGKFVAIPGIEWGTVATGNHINIFGATTLPPDTIDDDDYKELYAWIGSNARFAQWNHPYGWGDKSNRNKDVGNYGKDLYDSTAQFVAAANPSVQLMSIICTVFGGHINGALAESEDKTHRDVKTTALNTYKRHLDMGFHLSPAGSQDTHRVNPGTVTAARTGVWVDALSLDGITEGFKANRTFATEDDELAVSLRVEYGGKTYWMGGNVPLTTEEADVTLLVDIHQLSTTNDPTDEGPYTVILFSDSDGVGGKKAAEWDTFDARAGETTRIEVPVVVGEYIFLEIVEQNGKDNPVGDGEDVEEPLDERDNMNDSAWVTPVWFTGQAAGAAFVWSKNSKIYHDPNCWAVKRIGAANRREGSAPAGKTKHACKPQ